MTYLIVEGSRSNRCLKHDVHCASIVRRPANITFPWVGFSLAGNEKVRDPEAAKASFRG